MNIDSYKTAIRRSSLSMPARVCLPYIRTDHFDFGCGRGDDLRNLRKHGVDGSGWDPHWSPDALKRPSASVSLFYVLNVIPCPLERVRTILEAWNLTKEVLLVAVRVKRPPNFKDLIEYSDGVVTSANTFQKYYTVNELYEFVSNVIEDTGVVTKITNGILMVTRHHIVLE